MRELYGGSKVVPDEDVQILDGIVYIIYEGGSACKKIAVDAEFDAPISLADIAEEYPGVCMVIEEDFLNGHVFRYGNHPGETWELVGELVGYA